MTDLRVARHRQTRDALLDAAIHLFDARGFTEVTVEEIAAAAGVSRRTAYRRFRSKEDILLELPRRWIEVFDGFVAANSGLTGIDLAEGASLAVSAYIDDHRHETMVGLRALAEAPGLNGASVAHDDWHRRVSELLASTGLAGDDADLLAGAYLGGVNAMLVVWADADGERSLVELNRHLNERLRPVWRR